MRRFGLGATLLCLSCSLLPAVTEPIGVAVSAGNIVLNNASLPGSATVFEGATLGSGSNTSTQVRLNNGARVRLAMASSAKVYRDHADLIVGMAEISGYTANAHGLKISADGNSSASVSMRGNTIEVADLSGDVHVFNAHGLSVANLVPGRVMSFFPQDAGASAPSSLVGCPVKSGNNFLLTDETSNVTVELRGGNVRAGRRSQVTGAAVPNATPAAGASQVINVTNVKEVGGACKGAAAAGTAAGTAAGVAAGTVGIVLGATAAVVSGVTAAVVTTTTNNGTSSTTAGSFSTTYQDASGNIYTVTTVTNSNGSTTQTFTETNSTTGQTTTIPALPTTGLTCISACT